MTQRFFVDSPITQHMATLVGAEAHHASHVMRRRVGDEVVLFDGGGAEYRARITKIGRSTVELAVLERCEVDRELPGSLVFGIALPKGERQRWLIEKVVELGVHRVVPLVTRRGVAQPVDKALARLRRLVIEAAKQCGRNRLLEIGEPQQVADFLNQAPPRTTRLIAHPGGDPVSLDALAGNTIHLAVGPEGGFVDEELIASRAASWRPIDLGPRMLRIETAAVALAACRALLVEGL